MNFLKKLTMKNKGGILEHCDYCIELYKKSKTCGNCSTLICMSCYKENKLCIRCDEEYEEWVDKLQTLKVHKEKENKYKEAGGDGLELLI